MVLCLVILQLVYWSVEKVRKDRFWSCPCLRGRTDLKSDPTLQINGLTALPFRKFQIKLA